MESELFSEQQLKLELCVVSFDQDNKMTIEAAKPEMWGGRLPEAEEAVQLAACFAYEWQEALSRMLRHWETPPTTTKY